MMKLISTVLLIVLAVHFGESRVQKQRGLTISDGFENVPGKHPYLFLTVPRGRVGPIRSGFERIDDDDVDDDLEDYSANHNDDDADDDDNADDDDDEHNGDGIVDDDDDGDDDDNENVGIEGIIKQGSFRAVLNNANLAEIANGDHEMLDGNIDASKLIQALSNKERSPAISNLQKILQNAKPTQMMVAKEHAGAIMVPDGIIEIEGQSVFDEKTGKSALLVPRAALDAIPDGSVVALMEKSNESDDEEEERANRVIVRRRRRGSRRGVKRRVYGNSVRRRPINGNRNRRRRVNNRKNVRVIRAGGNRRRGGGNRRVVNRPIVLQG